MHGLKQATGVIARCVAPICLALLLMGAAPPKPVIGIIVDFGPRGKVHGKLPFTVQRVGQTPLMVRESEIMYAGDTIAFDDTADPHSTFVDVLVSGDKVVRLDPNNRTLPDQEWGVWQVLWPRLVAAYRWVASSPEDDAKLENAVSRGVDDALTVLPNVRRPLIISDDSKTPLWLGWHGGKPPFTLTAAADGKQIAQVIVCPTGGAQDCNREATLPVGDAGREIELSVTGADGATWKKQIVRQPIAWRGELVDVGPLGRLGPFLRATDLLDRGHGEYVLESARLLNSASPPDPLSRTLLKQIRDGQIP